MDKNFLKKRYIKPSTEVYNMNTTRILCDSGVDPWEWQYQGA